MCQIAEDVNSLTLKNKTNGQLCKFAIFRDELLTGIRKSESVSNYDMSRLEVEYDYETENEQIRQSTTMLFTDLNDAINFFVEQDPLLLIDNLNN